MRWPNSAKSRKGQKVGDGFSLSASSFRAEGTTAAAFSVENRRRMKKIFKKTCLFLCAYAFFLFFFSRRYKPSERAARSKRKTKIVDCVRLFISVRPLGLEKLINRIVGPVHGNL